MGSQNVIVFGDLILLVESNWDNFNDYYIAHAYIYVRGDVNSGQRLLTKTTIIGPPRTIDDFTFNLVVIYIVHVYLTALLFFKVE